MVSRSSFRGAVSGAVPLSANVLIEEVVRYFFEFINSGGRHPHVVVEHEGGELRSVDENYLFRLDPIHKIPGFLRELRSRENDAFLGSNVIHAADESSIEAFRKV